MTPLTDEELKAIRERLEAATPGPWLIDRCNIDDREIIYVDHMRDYAGNRIALARTFQIVGDGEFIANARTDMERLLAAYEEYRKEVDQLRVQLAGCGVAALGCRPFAVKGEFGWSASYGDVVTLREKYEESQKEVERLQFEIAHMKVQANPLAKATREYLKDK